MICSFWKIATNADWVWFWLFNDLNRQWQLLASYPTTDHTIVPKTLSFPASTTVLDYVDLAKKPILVTDIQGWKADREQITYRVALADSLQKMGCAGFQSVPLLPPESKDDNPAFTHTPKLRMSISAHYRDSIRRVPHDDDSLLMMGRATAQAVMTSYLMTASANRERQIATVRHDLLAPLQMIRDTVESMLPDPLPFHEDIPTHLKDLLFCAITCFHLVPLLDPNPSEIAQCENTLIMLAGDIVARLKAMLTPFAQRQSDMRIRFGDFSKIPPIKGDRTLIERALYNLIMNAIKYGTRGTEIAIIPTLTREGVVLGVMNEGVGVAEDEKQEIFEGNYRSPRSQRALLGLGLGLKIARAAMRKQGGDLVLSQAKNPTIFSIIIPNRQIA